MELVEHRRGVQRLGTEHSDNRGSDEDDARVDRIRTKDRDNDRDMSDCESETSEVLSVGSEPMPATDGLPADREDDPRSDEHYDSDAGMNIATRGCDTSREQLPGRPTLIGSSPSSRSPSPSPSSSASCNPPQSPASNYCATPPQRQASPSSPAASSVRSPASSSATASSPGRPDAHPEAIVPRYQSASVSAGINHHVGMHQNNHHHHHHHHQHLLSSNRYAAAALVTSCRDSSDIGEYSSVISGTTIPRIPGLPGHQSVGLSGVGHGVSAVADLIGYTQQSIDPARSLHGRPTPTLNVPLVSRLSLSPPTAMTVTGLQANAPSTAFHPVAVVAAAAAAAAAAGCRDPRESNPLLAGHPAHLQHSAHGIQHSLLQQQASVGGSQIQHVPASSAVLHHHHPHHHQQQQHHHGSHNSRHNPVGHQSQHRLSVGKLLQDSSNLRDTESPVSPRDDEHHRHPNHHHHHQEVTRSNQSPGNNSLQNTSGVPGANNNHHRNNNNNNSSSNNNNNNNNMQHQASLKFSIDNILKADFGRRITDPISLKKSRPKKVVPRPIDLTKDFLESSSEGSERSSETSATNPSPGVTSALNTSGSGASNNATSGSTTTTAGATTNGSTTDAPKQMLWPAWVYCTRYSDRPSSGPRTRRVKRPSDSRGTAATPEEKRPRTAFSGEQLARLKREFAENRYLTERRRQQLSRDLGLNEAQIKIWFQNKRAKIKKASGQKNPLALQLMAQGLYNHSTVPLTKEEEEQAAELQAK